MGIFADEAKKASEQTDKELAEELKDLQTKELSSCFPNPSDKELINQLADVIQKSTNKNETLTACKMIALKLSSEGLKAFKDGFQIAKKLAL